MCLSLSPTWNTGNGLFDHYLPVSLASTGTACYDCWCAALTGQKHTCKLKHSGEKKKSGTVMSVGIQTHPQGGITMTTSSGGKARVYYSIFGFQLASAAARLAEVYTHIRTNGQFSIQCVWLYVCLMWEETRRSPIWSNGENVYWIVSQRQTSLPFVCLTVSTVDILWLAENVCRQTGKRRNNI